MTPQSFADPEEAHAALKADWSYSYPEAVDDEVVDHLEANEDGRWRWRFDAAAVVTACSEMAHPPVVPPSTVPTLLVIAKRAGFVRPEFVASCQGALGENLTVAEVDSDHMLYLERPDEVGSLLRRFLTSSAP
jgi:lipase